MQRNRLVMWLTFGGMFLIHTNLFAQLFIIGGGAEDIDGNVYESIIIDSVEILSENLKTSRYSNGDSIPNVQDGVDWKLLGTGAWVNYNNDPAYDSTYGKLYNWFAVDDPRGLCPSGWTVPSREQWYDLAKLMQPGCDENVNQVGGKLKSTSLWLSPNTGASNQAGFSAFPGGRYSPTHPDSNHYVFRSLGEVGGFWSSTEVNSDVAWWRFLRHDHESFFISAGVEDWKQEGFSVRCVRSALSSDVPDELIESAVVIFPVPAQGEIIIKTPASLQGQGYKILDVHGKVVLTGSIKMPTTLVDISAVPAGLYVVLIDAIVARTIQVIGR